MRFVDKHLIDCIGIISIPENMNEFFDYLKTIYTYFLKKFNNIFKETIFLCNNLIKIEKIIESNNINFKIYVIKNPNVEFNDAVYGTYLCVIDNFVIINPGPWMEFVTAEIKRNVIEMIEEIKKDKKKEEEDILQTISNWTKFIKYI